MTPGNEPGRDVPPRDGVPPRDVEGRLGDALRRAGGEARPREEFREALRARFVEGSFVSSPWLRRLVPLPRWAFYPAAAVGLVALAGGLLDAFRPPAAEEVTAPPPQIAALRAARDELRYLPPFGPFDLSGAVVEARPFLLPRGGPGVSTHLRGIALRIAEVEALLASEFPLVAATPALPVVTVVAPDRATFEEVVGPRILPLEPGPWLVALSLEPEGVLLLSPEAVDPVEALAETMDVQHEAAHRWLRSRAVRRDALPLWVDEGVADVHSQSCEGMRTREWCRQVLAYLRSEGFTPFRPDEVLAFRDYGAMVLRARESAPCPSRPDVFVCAFHAEADSLVQFLMDGGADGARRKGFHAFVRRVLAGESFDATTTAATLGFPTVEALFAARDAWLGAP